MKMTDMVAVVTGGASGIGAEIVQELLHAGARVMIADINELNAALLMNEAHQNGFDKVEFTDCDVRKIEALENLLVDTKLKYGRLDIIINCAGIFNKAPEMARTAIETKLVAVMISTYKGITLMSKKNESNNRGGVIVNISASYGLTTERDSWEGIPAFAIAAETGVVSFTRSMGFRDDDDGMRFACVCPGAVETRSAKYNWERRPSSQAYADRVGITQIPDVVKAVNQAIESQKRCVVLELKPNTDPATAKKESTLIIEA